MIRKEKLKIIENTISNFLKDTEKTSMEIWYHSKSNIHKPIYVLVLNKYWSWYMKITKKDIIKIYKQTKKQKSLYVKYYFKNESYSLPLWDIKEVI